MTDRRTFLAGLAGTSFVAVAGCRGIDRPQVSTPTSDRPTGRASGGTPRVAGTVAEGLNVPWGIVFLPDGRALVAQRDAGTIVVIDPDATGDRRVRELGEVPGSEGGGERGLLGLALDPDDAEQLFAFTSTAGDERIVRCQLRGDRLGDIEPILTGLPTGGRHHGGRILFGPDGHLYVGTGEAGQPELAQDRESLGGKILRITPEGKPVDGNPFDNEVWSWGHRNVEGLAFDAEDRLWACEFGENKVDELNLIEKGRNYGWPEFEGASDDPDYVTPKVTWPTGDCSPSGMAIAASTAFVAGLRGERLWSVPLDGTDVGEPQDHFVGEYGRLRTVVVAPDESLWLTTSNTDGRGRRREGDDRILRVVLD